MTCQRTYYCNLCRAPVDDSTGRGVYFMSRRPNRGPHFDYQPVRQVEHHLCERCIEAVLMHGAATPAPAGKEEQ